MSLLVNAILGNEDEVVEDLVRQHPEWVHSDCAVRYRETAAGVPFAAEHEAEAEADDEPNVVKPLHYALFRAFDASRMLTDYRDHSVDGAFRQSRRTVVALLEAGASLQPPRGRRSVVLRDWSDLLVPPECLEPVHFMVFLKRLYPLSQAAQRAMSDIVGLLLEYRRASEAHSESDSESVSESESAVFNVGLELDVLRALRASSEHCDVRLEFGDGEPPLTAHRAVLAQTSAYMARLVAWEDTAKSRVLVLQPQDGRRVWVRVLDHLYGVQDTGVEHGSVRETLALLQFAHRAILKNLVAKCDRQLAGLVSDDDLLEMMEVCQTMSESVPNLRRALDKYLDANWRRLVRIFIPETFRSLAALDDRWNGSRSMVH